MVLHYIHLLFLCWGVFHLLQVCFQLCVNTNKHMCAQSFPTLCDSVDCSLPGSSVHGVFQARIMKWVAISSSRGSSPTQGLNLHLLHLLYWQADSLPLSHQGSPICIIKPRVFSYTGKRKKSVYSIFIETRNLCIITLKNYGQFFSSFSEI